MPHFRYIPGMKHGDVTPDWEGLLACIQRKGTPERVHHIELFLDAEIQEAVVGKFKLLNGISGDDPFFSEKRHLAVQRFLGYDYVRCGVEGLDMPLKHVVTDDTAELAKKGGRSFVDLHKGPITSRDEFESYPWPDPDAVTTRSLEWYQDNLPDDMCIVGSGGFAHFAEMLSWLMGYETLCISLFDQRDLVEDISKRLLDIYEKTLKKLLEFDRIKIIWGSDDMGFRTQTLISPDDLREFVLPGHKLMARMSHDAGRPYLLHACGKLEAIMDDLIDDVRIDAIHSFEDTIIAVEASKKQYGDRLTLLGGIDVDFLCRSSEANIRRRVRTTLEKCMPGGGYCLGTGNSVANYIPLDNYLVMMDEGNKFATSGSG